MSNASNFKPVRHKETLVTIVAKGKRHIFMVSLPVDEKGSAKIPVPVYENLLKRAGVGSNDLFSLSS